jgi:GTP-binding protein
VERTRLLLHLVDISADDPIQNYHIIQQELQNYPARLSDKRQLLVLNKADLMLPEDLEHWREQFAAETGHPPLVISAATRQGTAELIRAMQQLLAEIPPIPETLTEQPEILPKPESDQPEFAIYLDGEIYVVESPALERLLELSDLHDSRALQRFHKQMEKMGVLAALKAEGASSGDTVRMGDLEFDYL